MRIGLLLIIPGMLLAASAYADGTPTAKPVEPDYFNEHDNTVRLKDIGRFLGWRDNALIGYGIVTGLTGSGDSPRNAGTRQALSNALSRLGATVPADAIQSRNVAAVMVTASLPPSANTGDRIDVTVTSIGDARSLAGGVLLMTPLLGPDQRVYALAQGALAIGGYNFRDNINLRQKNYPTAGIIAGGATVETHVTSNLVGSDGRLTFLLKEPDFTTAQRIADAISGATGGAATVESAEAIHVTASSDVNRQIAMLESLAVTPDQSAKVVINERSGTVVAGGGVRISSVVIAQGDIKISVTADNQAQPFFYDSAYGGRPGSRRGLIVTNSTLDVSDSSSDVAVSFPNTTVADLVRGLGQAKVGTRDMISILQAMKTAGALHAEIIVQ